MAKTARGGVRDQSFVGVDQGPCDRRVIRASRPSKQGDPAAQACGPLGMPVGAFSNRSADRLPLPALTARDVPPALVAIPTRTFDLAHEFGNQAAIRCIAKASAECVDLSMSQIQGAALLH